MSSIVKKLSHFTPRLKKDLKRRGKVPSTPPSTQPKTATDETQNTPEEAPPLPSTPHSQHGLPSDFNFGLSLLNLDPLPEAPVSEAVDPKDTTVPTQKTAHDELGDEHDEYGDNDIFKKPSEAVRRHLSVKNPRRLSGISQPQLRHRSGSISMVVAPTSSVPPELLPEPPMRIGIPVSKPVKRRRQLLAGARPLRKRLLVSTALVIAAPREKTPSEVPEEEVERDTPPPPEIAPGTVFIAGVDPVTNKVRKFRVRTDENRHLVDTEENLLRKNYIPFAPENLETRITSIKQLPLSIPDEDAEIFLRIVLQSDKISMAELCKPTLSIGALSSNFEAATAAKKVLQERKQQRKLHRQVARTERISLEDASGEKEDEKPVRPRQALFLDAEEVPAGTQNTLKVQLVNGKMEVDQESTVVNRHLQVLGGDREVELSNDFLNPVTSSTYSKRRHTDRWTSDELTQFYNALSTWGTDFTFIAQLFPYRTRKQIKLKFNLEEKRVPEVVAMALKRKLPADFEKYCRDLKNKIETMEVYNEQLRQVRVRHEAHMAEIKTERERALQEDLQASRRREIEIRTGAKPMTRAERVRELRKNELVLGSIEDVKKQRTDVETEV